MVEGFEHAVKGCVPQANRVIACIGSLRESHLSGPSHLRNGIDNTGGVGDDVSSAPTVTR
jgi:hypothetical protein